MPLPVDVATLPLYLWERGHGIRLDPVKDLEEVLPWARAGTLVFWWLLLAYTRLAGRQLAGGWGGRLAVACLASEPTLLAHASLATTDLAVTACLLALVYHYRKGRNAGCIRRVALPAFWFAATMLAKASGMVFGPLCLVVVELEGLLRRENGGARDESEASAKRKRGRELAQIVGGGLLLTFLYCGSDWLPEPSFVQWTHQLPGSPISRALVWFAEHLRIFSNAGEGLARQVKHNMHGHGTYLLGTVADRAIWYYFPVALTMKLSIPFLIWPLLVLAFRPAALWNWACLCALALLAFSVTYRVQIGIRLVLPLIALAAVGLAAAIVQIGRWLATREAAGQRASVSEWAGRYVLPLLIAAGIAWTATDSLCVWPHGLCYTNEFWGGTRQGYVCLSDSNYDWGQGLKELARWQRQHSDGPLDVWYFGQDPALTSLPMRELRLHGLAIKGPEDFLTLVRGHYLAVSTSLLYGSIRTTLRSNATALEAYEQVCAVLRGRLPIDRTTTYLIYDFREATGNRSERERVGDGHSNAVNSPSPSSFVKAQP
jgi:hypothetical protein